jgi:hypothetical protein
MCLHAHTLVPGLPFENQAIPNIIGNQLLDSIQTEWETRHSFIKDMRHGHENFQGESLVGVYRHSIGELHPT